MKFFQHALLSAVAITTLPVQALIFEINHYVHQETNQSVFLCNDLHMDAQDGSYSKKQHDDLISVMKEMNAECIVEDIATYTGTDATVQQWVDNNAHLTKQMAYNCNLTLINETKSSTPENKTFKPYIITPLSLLEKDCKANNISCINIENRHAALTYGLTIEHEKFEQAIKTAIEQFAKEYDNSKINEINKKKRDAEQQKLDELLELMHSFNGLNEKLIPLLKPTLTQQLAPSIISVGITLCDANIAKALSDSTNKNICVIAGAMHCYNLENDYLPALGFKKVDSLNHKKSSFANCKTAQDIEKVSAVIGSNPLSSFTIPLLDIEKSFTQLQK